MKNWHQKLFILVIVLLLALPMTYMLGVKDKTVLNGVEPQTELPSLQEKSWKDRAFQQNFEKWWASHFGFRKLALKTKNTLYDLANLNKIHAGYSGTLIETEGGNLIEKGAIDLLYDQTCMQNKETIALKLRKLVKTLQADDRQLLFVLLPTKADVYEKEIPVRFKFFAHRKFDIYEWWEKLLKELDIPYINAVSTIKNMAEKEGWEPYSRTGTHLGTYGAFRVTEEIFKKLGLGQLTIKEVRMENLPLQGERDIANLINTFIPYLPEEIFPDVVLNQDKKTAGQFALIGDSYNGAFAYTVMKNKIVDPLHIWSKFNRLIKEEEVPAFFNNKDVYLFINQGGNLNAPHASMYRNIDMVTKKMPTYFMHDWLRDERGGFVSTDKSRIVIPNVDKNDVKLKFTTSQIGGKLVANGKEIAIDKQKFETILPGKDTDGKYRFLVTLKTEKPVTLSQITVQPLLFARTYNFANKTLPIETSGLSFAESWGRWSDGDVVTLRLDVPQNKPLKFTVPNPRVLLYPDNPKVVGTVYANGVKVGSWVFQYKKSLPKTEFVVPINVLKIKKPLDIEIKIDGAKAPIDLGVNKDKRRLGLGFRTLSITTAQ